ncbi:MAG: Fpg/Nei family DNA glycosylase [Actinomycetota bacterium]|nr:Fpg/Nei family DNA glycosylase [Actinomycetota bacterium]
MPEGDSVWRAGRRLNRGLREHLIVRSDFRVPRHATADLTGLRVRGTETHGKHLFTRFDDDLSLHTHLRMDGEWTVLGVGKRLPARLADNIRVLLETDGGQLAVALRMPVVELMRTSDEVRITDLLGPDPLRHDWDATEAVRRLGADPARALVAALLDQRLLAGLGNLWVNELLFVRGHSPWTPACEVDLTRLVAMAVRMLRQSITVRGNGQVTTGDPRAGHEHWVYGRSGQPCRRCGTAVRHVGEIPGDAERRATWWCPSCQPGPGPDDHRRPGQR